MANTYHQIYIHTIFAVKFRKGMIQDNWESRFHSIVGNLITKTGGNPILINGMPDHIHCFLHGKPSVSISDMMKSVKAKSSKWINDQNLLSHRFAWQSGYGCFTYGHSQKHQVYHYIKN